MSAALANVLLVHWHEGEAGARAAGLRAAGYAVRVHSNQSATVDLKNGLPEAVIISLERLPSHGRAIAAWFAEAKSRQRIPIIFAGGGPDKVAATRAKFPTSFYCAATDVSEAVRAVLQTPAAAAPTAPSTSGYSGKPLAQKLGLKEDTRFLVLHAPPEWDQWIGLLPAGAKRVTALKGPLDLAVIFVKSAARLTSEFPRMAQAIGEKRALWAAWPKKTSGVKTDLTEDVVRQIGIDVGWVDVKVCAINEVWSALQFRRRSR